MILRAVVAFITIGFISLASTAEERSLEEFKAYAKKRLPNLNAKQLARFAKLVDSNSDGKITDAEFSQRGNALRKLSSQPTVTKSKSSSSDSASKKLTVRLSPLTSTDKATILLITADELAKAWLPFARWKTRSGRVCKILTVNQISEDCEGPTIQEKIRKCVRKHIDNHGTQFVILGGDSLPGGKGLVPGGPLTRHRQEPRGIPTDIIYLSPKNWDADGDGVFGEWKDDRDAIVYPDGSVGLGRIPVRTKEDVAAFTEKVIQYESKYPTKGFATQMVYTCTDSPAYPKVRRSWDSYVSKVWDGEVKRFFSQKTPWDKEGKPGSYDLSSDNLVALFNGRTTGKLHIHGHGHLPAWVLERSTFTSKHVKQLKHDGAYPLITTVSCNTGEYDSVNDPSIVELMIRQPQGGSVAVVAPIRTGKPHFHNPAKDFRLMVTEGKLDGTTMTMTRYWSNGLGGGQPTGKSLMMAKAAMAGDAIKSPNYHLCICELNLLGDPTLDMRAESPKPVKIQAPKSIGLGKQFLELVTDAPKCTICLWMGKSIYQVVKTDKDGKVSIELNPKQPGELSVAVAGENLNTTLTTITIK